jgi:hypothetical protein
VAFSGRTSVGTISVPERRTSRTAPRDTFMARAMPRILCPCSCSFRIAARAPWSNITHLLIKAFDQAFDFALALIE